MAKPKSSLEERFEEMEARLRATERRLDASETRTRHLEANRANLNRENKRLREHNAILQEKVRELTARLNQTSSNSSKPPSSDVPWRERRKQKPAHDEALDAIQSAEFVNCDETGWRENNEKAWLWGAVTPMLKVFRIDLRRNREAFRRLLFAIVGYLITDRFSVCVRDDWG